MTNSESSSNNVAIVALIVVAVLIAGGGLLYFSGNIGGRDVVHRETVVERQKESPASEIKEADGFSLKVETDDGTKTEIKAP